jgi:carbamoyltransferase
LTILGLNAYHGDSAACLLRDGRLIAAAEEERFRRVKHWAGLPTEAIGWCLREARIQLGDVDHVAINRNPKVNHLRRLGFLLTHRPDFRLVLNRIKNIGHAATVESALAAAFPGQTLAAQVHHVEHHLSHLASAFLVSPFEEAVCLSIDGFGDFASAAWGMGQGGDIQIDGRVYFPHSLGIFYSAITQFIGFPYFGDEYKVMGLAPYGEPKFIEAMRQIVLIQPDGTYKLNLKLFRHHVENVSYSWHDCAPEVGTLYKPELEQLLGPARKKGEPLEQRHKDLARSAQAIYEEAFFGLLNALYKKYNCPNLALSGGCAMNSVANGKVYLRSPFKRMYLPAAAGDAGGAIGAAFVVWGQEKGDGRRAEGEGRGEKGEGRTEKANGRSASNIQHPTSNIQRNGRFVMRHAYTGPEFNDEEIEALLSSRGLLGDGAAQVFEHKDPASVAAGAFSLATSVSIAPATHQASALATGPRPSALDARPSAFSVTHFEDANQLCRLTAEAVSEGKVVGWFQGRMEWGPRALGNRSILGDPRRADMKDILNAKIKRRESFRPFAPSILRERVSEWFEQDDDVPFMMQVFQVRADKRALVPATTHVDGSGRLQTVHRDTNPLYHSLIQRFNDLTGVPMVLNTSFNENEPVVCRPEEALDCFLRTKMDVLVLGNFFVRRKS